MVSGTSPRQFPSPVTFQPLPSSWRAVVAAKPVIEVWLSTITGVTRATGDGFVDGLGEGFGVDVGDGFADVEGVGVGVGGVLRDGSGDALGWLLGVDETGTTGKASEESSTVSQPYTPTPRATVETATMRTGRTTEKGVRLAR